MGACYGRCCPQRKQRRYKRSHYFNGESVVEFENLIDESPKEPVSISSWLSFMTPKHAMEEKELELEEAAALEARKEALRIMKMAQTSDIMNPAKLAIGCNQAQWQGENVENWNISEQECRNKKMDPEMKARDSWIDQNFKCIASCTKDHMHAYSSTPPSSLDLEWENEIGITTHQNTHIEEDCNLVMSDTNSVYSNCSTQISNGNELEWDGDFTSAHISELDLETERLISEIEQMTSNALNCTSPKR